MFSGYGYRIDSSSGQMACAVLAQGQPPSKSATNINYFHWATGDTNVVYLPKTAEEQAIVLERDLQECVHPKGSLNGNQPDKVHMSRYDTRECCLDRSEPEMVESLAEKRYTLILREYFHGIRGLNICAP